MYVGWRLEVRGHGCSTDLCVCVRAFLMVLICWKWQDMSVDITISITRALSSLPIINTHIQDNQWSITTTEPSALQAYKYRLISDVWFVCVCVSTSSRPCSGWPGCSCPPLPSACRRRWRDGSPAPTCRCTEWPPPTWRTHTASNQTLTPAAVFHIQKPK